MNANLIVETIQKKGFDVRYSWSKKYDNGSSLYEFKIYKSRRHKKPLAFVQIGFYDKDYEVIGFTITYADRPSECIDCENLTDLESALAQIL